MKSAIAMILLLFSTAYAQNYRADWYVIAAGGGHSESANYMLEGTIGQAVTGSSSSANYIIESGFWVGRAGGVCGEYIIGDYNGNGAFNVADIISSFGKLKGQPNDPGLLCECPAGSGNSWAVAMDVNGSCSFNIADVIWGFGKLKGQPNILEACPDCPPENRIAPPGNDNPLALPTLRSKSRMIDDRSSGQ